jgi:hypothetical protein
MLYDFLDVGSVHPKASTYTGQHNAKQKNADIHASSEFRTHDSSAQIG